MSRYSRKDYVSIADIIRSYAQGRYSGDIKSLTDLFIDFFMTDDKRFDPDRFIEYIEKQYV